MKFIFLSLFLFSFGVSALGQDPYEPSVSTKENTILSEAYSTADSDVDEAISYLQDEISASSSPALDFTLGNLLLQADRVEEAKSAYQTALEKLPRFRAALINLGRVYLIQEQPEETIELYQQLVEDGQASADILLLLGHAFFMQDEPVGAESAYRQAFLLDTRNPEIRLSLAKALLQQERFREAEGLVEEHLNRSPEDTAAWSLRSSILLANDQPEQAMVVLEQARRLEVASPDQLATLGDLWMNQNRPEDALKVYREAFQSEDPSVARMIRATRGFLMVGDLEAAEEFLLRVDESEKTKAQRLEFYRLSASLSLAQNHPAKAKAALRTLLEENPLDGEALILLARVQIEEDALGQAVLTLERAARVKGSEADALVLHAQLEVNRGNYLRAIPLLESAQAYEDRDYVRTYLDQVRRLAELRP